MAAQRAAVARLPARERGGAGVTRRIPLEPASAIEGSASCRSGSGARLDVRTADPAQVERGNEHRDDADEVGFGDEVAQVLRKLRA